jgi:hypothetical protein
MHGHSPAPKPGKLLANGPARHRPKGEEVIKAQPQSLISQEACYGYITTMKEKRFPAQQQKASCHPLISIIHRELQDQVKRYVA